MFNFALFSHLLVCLYVCMYVCNLIIIHFRVQKKKMYFVVSDIDLKTFGSAELIVCTLGCIFLKVGLGF